MLQPAGDLPRQETSHGQVAQLERAGRGLDASIVESGQPEGALDSRAEKNEVAVGVHVVEAVELLCEPPPVLYAPDPAGRELQHAETDRRPGESEHRAGERRSSQDSHRPH